MSYILVIWAIPERITVANEGVGNTKLFNTYEEAAKFGDTIIEANTISGNENRLKYKVVEI